jgi:hypothetical protein
MSFVSFDVTFFHDHLKVARNPVDVYFMGNLRWGHSPKQKMPSIVLLSWNPRDILGTTIFSVASALKVMLSENVFPFQRTTPFPPSMEG